MSQTHTETSKSLNKSWLQLFNLVRAVVCNSTEKVSSITVALLPTNHSGHGIGPRSQIRGKYKQGDYYSCSKRKSGCRLQIPQSGVTLAYKRLSVTIAMCHSPA